MSRELAWMGFSWGSVSLMEGQAISSTMHYNVWSLNKINWKDLGGKVVHFNALCAAREEKGCMKGYNNKNWKMGNSLMNEKRKLRLAIFE